MAELKGTNIAAGIVPFTDQDRYPTHFSKYGKGGYMTVETIEERDLIPAERREIGMLCYVINDDTNIHTYRLGQDRTWETIQTAGIPIYGKEELDRYGAPTNGKYIFIPSDDDLSGEVEDNTITTSTNGSYIDILFSSIRQLQVEVAKMRNAFRYGMYSYTGTDTAMSGIISDIEDPEDEPIWSVEPDMLSLIPGASVEIDYDVKNLSPLSNVMVFTERLGIVGTVNWIDVDDVVSNNEDAKILTYLTISNLNAEINLTSKKGEKKIYLNNIPNLVILNKYNILVVVSRRSEEQGGKNFIWISIGNPDTNQTIKEGYFNFNTQDVQSTMVELDDFYTINYITLTNLDLYQLDFYSMHQDFSKDVIPSKPSDEDYKYRVAHLTIRSVSDRDMLESIFTQLPNNELIFEEATSKLWIKNNNKLIAVMGSGNSGGNNNEGIESDMTVDQLIEELKKLGIVYETTENGGDLRISSISDISFIHQATGKQFKFEVNSEGSLVSSEIPETTLEKRIQELSKTSFSINETEQFRGFVAKLHCSEAEVNPVQTKDVKLNSDRIKIGAVYMPLENDEVFGCSHAFVELENTSDKDFPLNGCYLHYLHPDVNNNSVVKHLALEGILPAGSTFLIRGKKYSDPKTNPNTFISVDDYDMEWYTNGELVDFTIKPDQPYGFALTYGQPELGVTRDSDILRRDNRDSETKDFAPNIHPWFYIDSLPINKHVDSTNKTWGANVVTAKTNSIIKNTFELDPAKQAFQALTTKDSSRTRLQNIANDVQVLSLKKPTISFPV